MSVYNLNPHFPYSFNQWGRALLAGMGITIDEQMGDENLTCVLIRQLAQLRYLLVLDKLETLLADEI